MDSEKREMTLAEWVERLPVDHSARHELQALHARLWRAENALLSASMGVMEPMQQYMQDYREPVERPSDQRGDTHGSHG